MRNGPALWARLLEIVDTPGAVIAGGCLRDRILDLEPKDYDIFVPIGDRAQLAALGDALNLHLISVEGPEARQYEEHFVGVLVGVLEGDIDGHPVNIVARRAHLASVEELLGSFDFGVVQAAYQQDGTIKTLPAFMADIENRTATLTAARNATLTNMSYERFRRFDARNPGVLRMVDPWSETHDLAY